MRIEAFIVHLTRAEKRRPQVDRLISALPWPAGIVDAVDGMTLDAEEIAAVYRPGLFSPRYPFAMKRSEIACFLSHRKAWRMIVERGLEAGLVVEDDVEPDAQCFARIAAFAAEHMSGRDVVRFPEKRRGDRGREIARQEDVSLVEPFHAGLGMQAQLVGRDAAMRLLDFTERFDRPVDTTLQMGWLHGVRVLAVRPVCIREVDGVLGGTTIQAAGKGIAERLEREWKRMLYRRNVRACSRRQRSRGYTE